MVQIRNRLGAFACAVALSLAGAAHAKTFDLTYTFASGDVISGTVDGTLDGSFVDNLHAINLTFDGSAFTGTIAAQTWDPTQSGFSAEAPRLSFDAASNEIVFLSSDGTYSFGLINDAANFGGQIVFATNLDSLDHSGASDLGTGTWSLTAAPIPEPGSFALVLAGLGLVGVAARRRAQ